MKIISRVKSGVEVTRGVAGNRKTFTEILKLLQLIGRAVAFGGFPGQGRT